MGRKNMIEESVGVRGHLPRQREESTPAPVEPETSTRIATPDDLPTPLPLGEGRSFDPIRKIAVLAPDAEVSVTLEPKAAVCRSPSGECVNHGACNAADGCMFPSEYKPESVPFEEEPPPRSIVDPANPPKKRGRR